MTLSINEHISAMIAADSSLQTMLGGRCYPIASVQEVAFPLAVYTRLSVTPVYDKSGKEICDTTVAIYVASDSYAEGVSIAEEIISALDKKTASYTGYDVVDARFTSASEDYTNGAYVQGIDFTFTIKEK